mgnify:CR=1 FL=1
MTKAEVIDRLNQDANYYREEIAFLERYIVSADEMKSEDVKYIISQAERIIRYAKDIEDRKSKLREIETRISIIERIDSI